MTTQYSQKRKTIVALSLLAMTALAWTSPRTIGSKKKAIQHPDEWLEGNEHSTNYGRGALGLIVLTFDGLSLDT
jgi:hypothetical protein